MLVRATMIAMAALVAPAQATTTVEVRSTRSVNEKGIDFSTSALHVRGGDEPNDLRLAPAEDGAVIVADTAGVTPGPGCTAQADGSARCVLPYTAIAAQVDVAGGDDHVLVTAGSAEVSGGAGTDTLEGPSGPYQYGNVLDGGPGDDVLRGSGVLRGGAGRDVLQGGAGDDVLNGDGGPTLEPDVIDGGDGTFDRVLYAGNSTPVQVDLADPGRDGGDLVTNVESAVGGAGDDRLAGTDGVNWLDGGGGDDVILGRGGADRLEGGSGDDRVDGGAGADRLEGGPGRDRLSGGDGADSLEPGGTRGANDCGRGADRLVDPGSHMRVGADCERLLLDLFVLTRVRRGSALRFALQWDDTNIFPPCRTNVTVKHGTRTVAAKTVRTPDGRLHRVTVPLPRSARRAPLRVTFRTSEGCRKRSGGDLAGAFVLGPPT